LNTNKNETESIKPPQQTGVFSSSITTPVAAAAPSTFGSFFGGSTSNTSFATSSPQAQTQNKESTKFGSLFGSTASSSFSTGLDTQNQNKESTASSIFGNAPSSTATTTTTTNDSAPTSNLFIKQTNSMFTFVNNANNKTEPTNTTGSGLFGVKNQSASLLFSSPAAQPVSSLFSSTAPSFGISNSQPATTSSSSDVFKNSPSSNNLFSLSFKPATAATSSPSPFIIGGSTSTPQQSTSSFGVSSSNNTVTSFQSSTTAPQKNVFNSPTDGTIKLANKFTFGATSTASTFLLQSNDQSNPHNKTNVQQNQQPAKINHTPSSNTVFNFNTNQTPSFNLTAQPSINFTSSPTNINNNLASAVGGAPFVFNSGPNSRQQIPQRLYKKPVRK
jgi:hypothetical protein